MKILIACEESQTVTKAFRLKGHEAFSCDIQECSGGHPEWHIQDDAINEAYNGGYDMMIAHPPCTYISRAGARWMYEGGEINNERLLQAMDAKEFFISLMHAPINQIAIENPTPLKIVGLPEHDQAIEPHYFGDPYSKKTLLWLKNLPPLISACFTDYEPFLPSNTGGKKRGQKSSVGVSRSQKESSKTFPGIAKAMANQWG